MNQNEYLEGIVYETCFGPIRAIDLGRIIDRRKIRSVADLDAVLGRLWELDMIPTAFAEPKPPSAEAVQFMRMNLLKFDPVVHEKVKSWSKEPPK